MNRLGPICFITGEIGRWSTVGGLGVMVDELTTSLANLNQEIVVISPYYDKNRKGQSNYLEKDSAKFSHLKNIDIYHNSQKITFGIHFGMCNKIKYYFIHNCHYFPKPYPPTDTEYTLKQMVYFAKASLQLLCSVHILPELIITNDWFTGLVAAYAKNGCFGDTFKGTTFFHICHNLDQSYEGRLYPNKDQGTLSNIHQLNDDWIVDPYWTQVVINPSRCAILKSDQWGTVSRSYRDELKKHSPLSSILNNHPCPFAYPNGIIKKNRIKKIQDVIGDKSKLQCKEELQKKYFGYDGLDDNVPLISFVGRITKQKGVLMVLNVAERLIEKYDKKINLLIGGCGDQSDPYVRQCIEKMKYLREKYPYCFWSNPYEFFTDCPRVNYGSNFGLMPSLFEPGGIVQHEFFVTSTPVIAFETGGLRDTVFDFNWETRMGNGITFNQYNEDCLINAIDRAITLFRNKDMYLRCCENAFNSVIDLSDVAKAWLKEFYRLRGKTFDENDIDRNKYISNEENNCSESRMSAIEKLKDLNKGKKTFSVQKNELEDLLRRQKEKINNMMPKTKIRESDTKSYTVYDSKLVKEADDNGSENTESTEYTGNDGEKISIVFSYEFTKKIPGSVQIVGSFDRWQVRYPLTPCNKDKTEWSVTLKVPHGKHFYKYIIDGEWVTNPQEQVQSDKDNNINNIIII